MPKTAEELREIRLANLRPDARAAHGLRGTLDPALWAPSWRKPYEVRLDELLQLEHIDSELDRGLCALIARTETMLGRAYEWVAKNGIASKGGRLRPVVVHIGKLERDLASFYTRAALSPTSRRQLGMSGGTGGIALVLSDADIEEMPDDDDAPETNDATGASGEHGGIEFGHPPPGDASTGVLGPFSDTSGAIPDTNQTNRGDPNAK